MQVNTSQASPSVAALPSASVTLRNEYGVPEVSAAQLRAFLASMPHDKLVELAFQAIRCLDATSSPETASVGSPLNHVRRQVHPPLDSSMTTPGEGSQQINSTTNASSGIVADSGDFSSENPSVPGELEHTRAGRDLEIVPTSASPVNVTVLSATNSPKAATESPRAAVAIAVAPPSTEEHVLIPPSSHCSAGVFGITNNADRSAKNSATATPVPEDSAPSTGRQQRQSLVFILNEEQLAPGPDGTDKDTASNKMNASTGSAASFRPPEGRRVRQSVGSLEKDKEGFETINQYLLMDELGRGAHGCVRRGERVLEDNAASFHVQDSTVAIKIIDKLHLRRDSPFVSETGSNAATTSRADPDQTYLLREVAVMKKISNVHIIRLIEAIDDAENNRLYLVMQFIPNGPVVHVNPVTGECTPLREVTVKTYLRQISSGLLYLHKKGIVHHDIKPDNLLVGENEMVYIADFGVSEICSSRDPKVHGHRGTPAFFAPELLAEKEMDDSVNGPPVDMWALGVTLYLMVFGKMPFRADNVEAMYEMIQKNDLTAESLPRDGIECSDLLKDIILRLLKKDPAERMTAQQLRNHKYFRQPRHEEALQRATETTLLDPHSGQADELLLSPGGQLDDAPIEVSENDIREAVVPKQPSPSRGAYSSYASPCLSRATTPPPPTLHPGD